MKAINVHLHTSQCYNAAPFKEAVYVPVSQAIETRSAAATVAWRDLERAAVWVAQYPGTWIRRNDGAFFLSADD